MVLGTLPQQLASNSGKHAASSPRLNEYGVILCFISTLYKLIAHFRHQADKCHQKRPQWGLMV
jgi:hypothetical protein